ncbi:glycosyltransferase family 2 protein [Spirosoma spitsbergense]|uniref:glycosyltransferase family 2 protein n=1 Tax=Spirosoma spitsbergense TaxID=431554 RepID=UPI00036DB1C0|nr:glycosyltransferase family 2 protein [Spirosoma spitsbergense]
MASISVCVASYNGEFFIRRQLQSILEQIGVDDEIIVSDDGSTDNTLQVINSFGDPRIRIVVNEYRQGPVGNYENALKHTSGDYVFLADQDDIWLPDKVLILSSLLKSYDLVLSDCEVVDNFGTVLHASFFNFRRSRQGFLRNLYRNSYMGCCMAFRREVLLYVLPFPNYIHMHDWWIGLLVEVKGNAFFYRKPLIQYVRHGSNASPTGDDGYGFTKRFINRFFLLSSVVKRLLK